MDGWGTMLQAGLAAVSQAKSDGERKQAQDQLSQILAQMQGIQLPDSKEIQPTQLGQSEAGYVKGNPEDKAAQMAALASLQRISDSGGETLEDKVNLNDTMNRLDQSAAGNRAAIEQSMRGRGTFDSGDQLTTQLAAASANQQQAGTFGAQTAAQAQKRALEAILQRGQLAGQMRGQGFNEDFQAAQARDAINKYNADAMNKASYYNAGLPQQQFDNQIKRAGGAAVAGGNLSKFYEGSSDRTGQQGAAYGVAAKNGVDAITKNMGKSDTAATNNGSDYSTAPTPMDTGASSEALTSGSDPGDWEYDEYGNLKRKNA